MAEISRRHVLRLGAAMWAATLGPWSSGEQAVAAFASGSLDPAGVAKYATALVIPSAMSRTATLRGGSIDRYAVGVRQFWQQILPPGGRKLRCGVTACSRVVLSADHTYATRTWPGDDQLNDVYNAVTGPSGSLWVISARAESC